MIGAASVKKTPQNMPKVMLNTSRTAKLVAKTQMTAHENPATNAENRNVLTRPNLSAATPMIMRPIALIADIIPIRTEAVEEEMLMDCA